MVTTCTGRENAIRFPSLCNNSIFCLIVLLSQSQQMEFLSIELLFPWLIWRFVISRGREFPARLLRERGSGTCIGKKLLSKSTKVCTGFNNGLWKMDRIGLFGCCLRG
jgi:hypothetical protein